MPSIASAAVGYALQGLKVFPVEPKGKRPLGKLAPHGCKDASSDPGTVAAWWATEPAANIGLACAAAMWALDVDGPSGEESLAELEAVHGQLPPTVESQTGGGGRHLLFRGGEGLKNLVKAKPGLDVRTGGGYIVLPPSVHSSGRTYEWAPGHAPGEVELADPPAWLLAALTPAPKDPTSAERTVLTPAGGGYWAAALDRACEAVALAPEGQRNDRLNREAFSIAGLVAAGMGDESEARRRLEAAALSAGLFPGEAAATLASGWKAGLAQPRPAPETESRLGNSVSTSTRDAASRPVSERCTDAGNARRLVVAHGADLRFARGLGWLAWDGGRWVADEGLAMAAAKATARAIWNEVRDEPNEDRRRALAKWALASESAVHLGAMVELAKSEPELKASPEDFDRDPWVMNVANGELDLRTGELRSHQRETLCTMQSSVAFDREAKAPRWVRFVHEIFDGDAELGGWFQRWTGYCLTGHTREHALAFLHGQGANGKSVAVETLRHILGAYAKTVPFDTFLARPSGGPTPDLAALRGRRLVVASEPDAGTRLAEGVVKSITGGDTISARALYEAPFEFRPVFKLMLSANHRPRISGGDAGIWRRVREVPFTISFLGREDRGLDEALAAELPGILAWAVEGLAAWRAQGLGTCAAVDRATGAYREQADSIGRFVSDRCELDPDASCPSAELRRAYLAWCESAGEEPIGQNLFAARLADRGLGTDKRTGGIRVRTGIRLSGGPHLDSGGEWRPSSERSPNNHGGFLV